MQEVTCNIECERRHESSRQHRVLPFVGPVRWHLAPPMCHTQHLTDRASRLTHDQASVAPRVRTRDDTRRARTVGLFSLGDGLARESAVSAGALASSRLEVTELKEITVHLSLSIGSQGNDITQASVRLPHAEVPAQLKGSGRTCALMMALLLTSALPGCASYPANEKCGDSGCISDAQITSQVQALFAQHSELRGPDQVYVTTKNHVVYLTGMVEIGLERDIAGSIAEGANGVTGVVNDISIEK